MRDIFNRWKNIVKLIRFPANVYDAFKPAWFCCSDMLEEAELLVKRMKEDKQIDFKNDWKLLTIFIGGNDLCMFCRVIIMFFSGDESFRLHALSDATHLRRDTISVPTNSNHLVLIITKRQFMNNRIWFGLELQMLFPAAGIICISFDCMQDGGKHHPDQFFEWFNRSLTYLEANTERMLIQLVSMFDVSPLEHFSTGLLCDLLQWLVCTDCFTL